MNVASHQEKEKIRRRARVKQGKIEYTRLISKRLHAALLRSFRGQHNGKMVCVRRVPGTTGTLGEVNSRFDPTQTKSGTAPPR